MGMKVTFGAAIALLVAATGAWADGHRGLPAGDPAALGFSAEKLASIPAKFQPLIGTGKIPGVITAVARDGKLVHFEATGSMDVERDKPMRDDTVFRMYSMTKPITGTAVMILVDEGKIDLSDPVAKYIPEFANTKVLAVAEDGSHALIDPKRPMTVEHLMTHTAGLVYGIFDGGPVGEAYNAAGLNTGGEAGVSLEETARLAASLPLIDHPGETWHYSIAMDILGRIVEVASGQRFGDFMAARIFEPLGMKDSAFMVTEGQADRFAANYEPDGQGGMKLMDDPATSTFIQPPSQDSGGGGMVGTAADYLRFAQMLLNRGELDGVRIISEGSATAITSQQLGPEHGLNPLGTLLGGAIDFTGIGFGYCGSVVMDGHDGTIFGSSGEYGWGGYASTDFWIDPAENIVGMVLTQLTPTGTYPTRIIMRNATYAALEDSRKAAHTD